jgi:heat shock protein HslJ
MTGRRPLLVLIGVATMALLLAACANSNDTRSATAGLPDTLQQLTANPWILDQGASSIGGADGYKITVTFKTAHVLSGATPCNLYKGTFSVGGTHVGVRHIVRASRPCGGQSDAAERDYFNALLRVQHVEPSDRDHLKLTGPSTRLSYKALPFRSVPEAMGGGAGA